MGMERPQSDVRLPVWGLVRWMVLPLLCVLALTGAIAMVREESGTMAAGVLAMVVVAISTIAGLTVVAQSGERPAGSWGLVVLLGQGVRMIGGLAVGLVAFFAARPEPMVFWMLFLVGMLSVLTGEVSFVVRWIRSECERVKKEAA